MSCSRSKAWWESFPSQNSLFFLQISVSSVFFPFYGILSINNLIHRFLIYVFEAACYRESGKQASENGLCFLRGVSHLPPSLSLLQWQICCWPRNHFPLTCIFYMHQTPENGKSIFQKMFYAKTSADLVFLVVVLVDIFIIIWDKSDFLGRQHIHVLRTVSGIFHLSMSDYLVIICE